MRKLLMFIILISGIFLTTNAFAWTSWSIGGGFSNGGYGGGYYGGGGYCVNPPFYSSVYIQPVMPMYYGGGGYYYHSRPRYYGGGGYYRGGVHHSRPRYYGGGARHNGGGYRVPYYKRSERHGGYPRNPGPRHYNGKRR